MTLYELLRKKVLGYNEGSEKLGENPNDDRYTYISDVEALNRRKLQEYKTWYYGDSSELLNFYTAMQSYGNADNPIYNRNKAQYFWGLSTTECNIKRIHSGLPKAIIDTLTNVIGTPTVSCAGCDDKIKHIFEKTGLTNIINQKQMPMTLACGWGAYKPVIDKSVCADSPLIEWYDAEDVDFIMKHGVIVGCLFKDYYKYAKKEYVLVETRRVHGEDSIIEYNLYRLEKNNEVSECPLDTIPELVGVEPLTIKGYGKMLAVPSIFFYDQYNVNYGKSILSGKIDLFDDLDQDLSQASQTSRVSTPVEYIPVDIIERGVDGKPRLPHLYNRQYVASSDFPNGDGELNGEIKTTQPQLNFEQYTNKVMSDLNLAITGILSPASLGLNMSRDDNALAQREKEKITLMTRDNIIDRQQIIIKQLTEMLLMLQDYMQTNSIPIGKYDISVKFPEFANPSFDSISATLTPMLAQGAISPELFVDKLYGDSLSDIDKAKEVAYIKDKQQQDSLQMGDFESMDIGNTNDTTITSDTGNQEQEQELAEQVKE